MNNQNSSESIKNAQLRKKTLPILKQSHCRVLNPLSCSPDPKKDDNKYFDVRITAEMLNRNNYQKQKQMNISIHMPITTQIIIGENGKNSPEPPYKSRKTIPRNISLYEKCTSSLLRKHNQSTNEFILNAYMSLANNNPTRITNGKKIRARGSLILDKDKTNNKSISLLKVRLPTMDIKPLNQSIGTNIKTIKKKIIQPFQSIKPSHKSMSVLPACKIKGSNISVEGRQIHNESNFKNTSLCMHLQRKSTIGSEYVSTISRNPFMESNSKYPTESKRSLLTLDKSCIEDVYIMLRVNRDEMIRLIPTLKCREWQVCIVQQSAKYIIDADTII